MRRTVSALLAALSLLCLTAGAVLAAPPSNDDIASPTIVGALPYTDGPYDTTEATTGATDPDDCFGSPDRSTVWYSFTPTTSGWYGADTFGSDYDTTLYVGTPDGSGGVDVIACNDDAGDNLQSAVRWEALAGTTYLLVVGTCCGGGVVGESGGGGTLVFHVDVASPPPTIDVTVDPTGTFDPQTDTATITGTVTCSEDAEFAFIDVELSQRVGRFIIRGFGGTGVTCDGTAQPWSVQVFGETGLFRGGKAQANVFAVACDEIDCASDFDEAEVRLRRAK